ncbi:hypothetical protein X726_00720 [Mesorhizobium sp. L103C105A0]|nr:hypothetical protein X726_00720 [Mesorhizobium sp. L103C105A0]
MLDLQTVVAGLFSTMPPTVIRQSALSTAEPCVFMASLEASLISATALACSATGAWLKIAVK